MNTLNTLETFETDFISLFRVLHLQIRRTIHQQFQNNVFYCVHKNGHNKRIKVNIISKLNVLLFSSFHIEYLHHRNTHAYCVRFIRQ